MIKRDILRTITLDYQKLKKTESNLASTLDLILKFKMDFIAKYKDDPSINVSELITRLRKAIEDLLTIGIVIGNNTLYFLSANLKLKK